MMKHLRRSIGVSGWLTIACATIVSPGMAHASPGITNLGTLGGVPESRAYAVSSDGSSVTGMLGYSPLAPDYVGFRWTAQGGMHELEMENARGISGDGSAVVGWSTSVLGGGGPSTALLWTESNGTVPVMGNSRAYAISRDGLTIVGSDGGAWVPGVFRQRSGVTEWIAAFGACLTVNGDGSVVAGYRSINAGPATRAFLWKDAGLQDLGTLGGTSSRGYGVSDSGLSIVGESDIAGDAETHAFLWTLNGMQDLGTLGGPLATAYAISGDGLSVAGMSDLTPGGDPHAFVWTHTLGMVDLNTYLPTLGIDLTGWSLTEARGLSLDGSVIAGTGLFHGETRAFLVTGVPAPATALVLLLGVTARRRR